MKINLLAFFVCAIVTLQASNTFFTPLPSSTFVIEDTPVPEIPVDTNLRTNHQYPEFSLMSAFDEAASNPFLTPRQSMAKENIPESPLILASVDVIDLNSPTSVRAANPLKGMDQYFPSPKAPLTKKSFFCKSESRQRSISNNNKFDFKKIISTSSKGGKKAQVSMNTKMKVD